MRGLKFVFAEGVVLGDADFARVIQRTGPKVREVDTRAGIAE
jgi:hypothetical protein